MYILVTRSKLTHVKVTRIKVREASSLQCFFQHCSKGVHPIRRRWGKNQFFEVMAVCQVRHLWSCNKDKDFTRADFDILPLHHHFPLLFVADFISWVEKITKMNSHPTTYDWKYTSISFTFCPEIFFFKFSSDSFLSMFNSRFLICSTLDDDRSL